jgi:AraC-like DNA-binding protein
MFDAEVAFEPGSVVSTGVHSVRRTNMHRHPNALEIVYVLRGGLHIKVSCEEFELQEGDYAVLNRGDPHALTGSEDNVTALAHVDLAACRDIDPYVGHIIFACESFDLARYRKQEAVLRGLILDLIDSPPGTARQRCRKLVGLLCNGYSLENYYNRTVNLSSAQREKYLAITQFLREHAAQRDVLGLLASEHHYSKSYVSHFVKEAWAISFSDLVGYIRVAMAENLLLSTDATMLEIAASCGFSDVKYFTRAFVDWFHQSPADYRKRYLPETRRDPETTAVSTETAQSMASEHRRRVAAPGDGPRLSVTPLLLKNLGSRLDLFEAVRTRDNDADPTGGPDEQSGPVHLIPIRVTKSDLDSGYTMDGLSSFSQVRATPCLVLDYTTVAGTLDLVTAVVRRLESSPDLQVVMWLAYNAFHDRQGVDEVVARAKSDHLIDIQPIMMP